MMDVTFSRFDAAEYLETEEDIAAYLDECAQDGDAGTIALALGAIARARNVSKLAREAGMTRTGLYKALSPGGNPSLDTVARVAKAMGFRLALMPMNVRTTAGTFTDRSIEARGTTQITGEIIVEEVGIRREPAERVENIASARERQES
jgi:probable addiction module antidote protein